MQRYSLPTQSDRVGTDHMKCPRNWQRLNAETKFPYSMEFRTAVLGPVTALPATTVFGAHVEALIQQAIDSAGIDGG